MSEVPLGSSESRVSMDAGVSGPGTDELSPRTSWGSGAGPGGGGRTAGASGSRDSCCTTTVGHAEPPGPDPRRHPRVTPAPPSSAFLAAAAVGFGAGAASAAAALAARIGAALRVVAGVLRSRRSRREPCFRLSPEPSNSPSGANGGGDVVGLVAKLRWQPQEAARPFVPLLRLP